MLSSTQMFYTLILQKVSISWLAWFFSKKWAVLNLIIVVCNTTENKWLFSKTKSRVFIMVHHELRKDLIWVHCFPSLLWMAFWTIYCCNIYLDTWLLSKSNFFLNVDKCSPMSFTKKAWINPHICLLRESFPKRIEESLLSVGKSLF